MNSFFSRNKTLFLSLGFLVLFSVTVSFATPPGSPFAPGSTLDPSCAPGETNCTVSVSSGGSITGITALNGNIGINNTNPQSSLDVTGTVHTTALSVDSNAVISGTMQARDINIAGYSASNSIVGDVPNAQATINYDSTSSYTAAGHYIEYDVYAYKTGSTVRVYSANAAIANVTDDSSSTSYSVNVSWDPVAGAEGYRVVQTVDNTTYAGYDTTGTSLVDGDGSVSFSSTPADYAVAPAGLYLNTNTINGYETSMHGSIIATGVLNEGAGVPSLGGGAALLWVPSAAVFRAGYVTGNQWGNSNVGLGSIGVGINATASGLASISMGYETSATADSAVAIGYNSHASGNSAVAIGYGSQANGTYSVAFGNGNTSSQENDTSFGLQNSASGGGSTAFGSYNIASGIGSTVFGINSVASGYLSNGFGEGINAGSRAVTAIGRFNVGGGNGTTWNNTDSLFEIGNGTDDSNRSNAFTVLKNGNTTIGGDLYVSGSITCGGSCGGGGLPADGVILAYDTNSSSTPVPDLNGGTRLMWYPSKAAFRAGSVNSDEWNDVNVGTNSTAMGANTIASAYGATAIGTDNIASGVSSTALGGNNTASGAYSSAFGISAQSTGDYSFSGGNGVIASGATSVALGLGATASGDYAVSIGVNTLASGIYSIAMGHDAQATEQGGIAIGIGANATGFSSSAFGLATVASGNLSTAMGYNATADSAYSMAIGSLNTLSGGDPLYWVPTDMLFQIGNGDPTTAIRSDALTLKKNGDLYVAGNITCGGDCGLPKDGTLLLQDTNAVNTTFPDLGGGTRLMWYPSNGAFRAGAVSSTQWNNTHVGQYSVAFGQENTASGNYSFTSGQNSEASGVGSVAMGIGTTASGANAIAFGTSTASGDYSSTFGQGVASGFGSVSFSGTSVGDFSSTFGQSSTAYGYASSAFTGSTAIGDYSVSFGFGNTATAMSSSVFGFGNVGGGDSVNWVDTDPLFEVGNTVTSPGRDALMILKNGYTGIGLDSGAPYPTVMLQVGSSALASGNVAHFENVDGTCDLDPTNTGGLSCTSDMNAKKNITILGDNSPWNFNTNITADNQSVLAKVLALKPVQYNFKSESDLDARHAGFIAQDVERIFPELVSTDAKGRKTLSYTGLVPYTIQAIQEMNITLQSLPTFDDPTLAQSVASFLRGIAIDKTARVDTVEANKICIQGVCLTKEDFQQLLQSRQQSGGGSAPAPEVQSPEVTPPAVETPEVTPPAESAPTDTGTE